MADIHSRHVGGDRVADRLAGGRLGGDAGSRPAAAEHAGGDRGPQAERQHSSPLCEANTNWLMMVRSTFSFAAEVSMRTPPGRRAAKTGIGRFRILLRRAFSRLLRVDCLAQ